VRDPRLGLREAEPERGEHVSDFLAQRGAWSSVPLTMTTKSSA